MGKLMIMTGVFFSILWVSKGWKWAVFCVALMLLGYPGMDQGEKVVKEQEKCKFLDGVGLLLAGITGFFGMFFWYAFSKEIMFTFVMTLTTAFIPYGILILLFRREKTPGRMYGIGYFIVRRYGGLGMERQENLPVRRASFLPWKRD